MRYFYHENETLISESELEKEFNELFKNDQTDCETFQEYVKEATSKNGTLTEEWETDGNIQIYANRIIDFVIQNTQDGNYTIDMQDLSNICETDLNSCDFERLVIELFKNESVISDIESSNYEKALDIVVYTDLIK